MGTCWQWLRRAATLVSATVLVACGGGGGGGGDATLPTLQAPPETAAALAQTPADAIEAVNGTVAGGEAVALQAGAASSLFLPTGDPFGRSGGLAFGRSAREQPLDSRTLGCAEFISLPCSGSLTLDASFDLDSEGDTVPAGSRLSLRFNGLQGDYAGVAVSLDGVLRFDFLTAFGADSLAGVRLQSSAIDFGGSVDGQSFGPETGALLIEFDAQSRVTLTADGMRFRDLSGVVVDDADDYRIGLGTVRRAHWGTTPRYVDVSLSGWNVVAGRPAVGAEATVAAGNDRFELAVTAASASTVTYRVEATIGGATVAYTVTASHAAGVPTYAATLAD